MPPAVDTCHWPPAAAPRARRAGRDKRPHVDLVPPRFVRLVGHPPAVRRERAIALAERGLQEHRRRAIAHHRHDPEVGVRLRVDAVIQQEAAVRRPAGGGLDLVGGHEPLLHARAARELLVEVTGTRPVRAEHDPRAVGRPDGKSVRSRIEREAARAGAVQQPEVPVALHRAGHDHATAVGGHAGSGDAWHPGRRRCPAPCPTGRPRSVAAGCPRPSGRPPAPSPPPRRRSWRHSRHPVGQRHRLARERGLRHIQPLGHERARPHPQQPPGGQIHPGAVGGRQPRRGAPVERAQIDPGRVRPAVARRTGTGGRRAETAARRGPAAAGRASSRPPPRPRWRTRASRESVALGANTMTPSAFHVPPRPGGGRRQGLRRAAAEVEPLQRIPGEEADGPAVGRPERETSPPRCPPAAAPSSSPATAATDGTRHHPRPRRRSAGRRARAQTSVGSVGGGRDDLDARLGRRGRRRFAQMPHRGNGERDDHHGGDGERGHPRQPSA